jgi:hypothetical protein
MLIAEFFKWWYGVGWQEAATGAIGLVKKIQLSFSIPVLLRTLFAPWKMIVTNPGRSLDDKMRALLDNLVSRTVGFFVRIFSLIAALVLMFIAAIIGGVIAITWPLVPVLIITALIKGITG